MDYKTIFDLAVNFKRASFAYDLHRSTCRLGCSQDTDDECPAGADLWMAELASRMQLFDALALLTQ